MKEILDTQILKEIGFLEPIRELVKEKNQKLRFAKLYQAFIELCQEYNLLGKKYRRLGKQVRKAISLESEATYPVALPYKWRRKSNLRGRSSKSIPKKKGKKGKSGE